MSIALPKPSAANLFWLLLYLGTEAAVVVGLLQACAWAMEELTTPAAQSAWQEWKEDATRQSGEDAENVRRRPPKSAEPPLLILLRDHFPGILVSCLIISSFLFGFIMLVVRGAMRRKVVS